MKYLAHLEPDVESKVISIYDVIKGLNSESPQNWEKRTYYSLWYNTPMIAKVNTGKRTPHFAFKKGLGGNEKSGGGEGIEHDLSKTIIHELKSLQLKIGKTQDELLFSKVIPEHPFENRQYITDLYCEIKNENKFGFPVGSMLAIELHYTHKVPPSKKKFYRQKNIPAIEITIFKKIKFEDDVQSLYKRLEGYFKKERIAKSLHNPNWQKAVQEEKKPTICKTDFPTEQIDFELPEDKSETVEQIIEESIPLKKTAPKQSIFQRILNFFIRK